MGPYNRDPMLRVGGDKALFINLSLHSVFEAPSEKEFGLHSVF